MTDNTGGCGCLFPLVPCVYSPPLDQEALSRRQRSEEIDKQIARERKGFREIHRLLLLGAGESGKSTIIKQMQLIHVDSFSESIRIERRNTIRNNLLEAIVSILSAMSTINPPVQFSNLENKNRADWILHNALKPDFDFPAIFYEHAIMLWKDKDVQAAFHRSNEYQLIDSAKYFLDKLDIVKEDSYLPSEQDILRCRVITTDIYELLFQVNNVKFLMIDVGGQRGERRKWFLCFNGVTAIIFLTALSSYNLYLREDCTKNRLVESLEIFRNVWKNRFLQNVSIILFLNKRDIFAEKIISGRNKLEEYFPEFATYKTPADAKEKLGDPEVVRAKYFIRDEFMKITKNNVGEKRNELHQCFPHFTCAIDTENIKNVFEDCRKIIQWSYLIQFNLC